MRIQIAFTSERLKEVRELAGHSQADLAFNLGCARKSVTRWERGRHRISDIYKRQLVAIYPDLINSKETC
jgi:transcriptional regulator with XRE-family HTH domain